MCKLNNKSALQSFDCQPIAISKGKEKLRESKLESKNKMDIDILKIETIVSVQVGILLGNPKSQVDKVQKQI